MRLRREANENSKLAKFSDEEKDVLFKSINRMKKGLLYVSEDTCCIYGTKLDNMACLTKLMHELVKGQIVSMSELLYCVIGVNCKNINTTDDFNKNVQMLIEELEKTKKHFKE